MNAKTLVAPLHHKDIIMVAQISSLRQPVPYLVLQAYN
jgi:hypothetical protein